MFIITKSDKSSIIKSLRIPQELLIRIEDICNKESITFTEFILQACNYCLTDLETNNYINDKN